MSDQPEKGQPFETCQLCGGASGYVGHDPEDKQFTHTFVRRQPPEAQPQVCTHCAEGNPRIQLTDGTWGHEYSEPDPYAPPSNPSHRIAWMATCTVPAAPAAPRCHENVAGGGSCVLPVGHNGIHVEWAAPDSPPALDADQSAYARESVPEDGRMTALRGPAQPMSARAMDWWNGLTDGQKATFLPEGLFSIGGNYQIMYRVAEAFAAHRTAALEQELAAYKEACGNLSPDDLDKVMDERFDKMGMGPISEALCDLAEQGQDLDLADSWLKRAEVAEQRNTLLVGLLRELRAKLPKTAKDETLANLLRRIEEAIKP